VIRIGDKVMILMRVLRDWQHSGVHSKGVSFFSRFISGLAKPVKFGIKCYRLGKQLNCQGVAAVQSGSATPTMHVSFMSHVYAKALEPFPLLNLYILIGTTSLKTF
jgi:hypothetical protein